MSEDRAVALLVHDDGDALDRLTQLFEAQGFEVVTAATGFRAQSDLESGRAIHVVIAPWDANHPVGENLYKWSLQRRYDLRAQFVFLADEVSHNFDEIVAGRCLVVSPSQPYEVLRVAVAAVARRSLLEKTPDPITDHGSRPSMLLVEDDPVLLRVIGDLLSETGFRVIQVDNGQAAIDHLMNEEYQVIVADWAMDNGSGIDVFHWMKAAKPWLTDRIVFLSSGERDDLQSASTGRPSVRKGQDSRQLLTVLREIVRQVHAEQSGMSFLPE